MSQSDLSDFLTGGDAGADEAERPPAAGVGRGRQDPPPGEENGGGAMPIGGVPPDSPGDRGQRPVAGGRGSREKAVLEGRYEIEPDRPLPQFNGFAAPAFAVTDTRQPTRPLVALVCTGGLPPRADVVPTLQTTDHPGLQRLVAAGATLWPGDGLARAMLIMDRPRGERVLNRIADTRPPMTEDRLARQLLKPLAAILRELKTRRMFHGAINPTNLFAGEGGEGTLQLGDCASGPPGYNQPVVFETLQRGMAQPAGRGNGTPQDDLYALGVCLLTLLWGEVPLKGLSETAIVDLKMAKGSFAALTADKRLPLNLMEPVKGLLIDDIAQRWTLEDLDLWLSGRRLSPKQATPSRRANRQLEFEGKNYINTLELAHAMAAKPFAANKLIESKQLATWLDRSMEDGQILAKVEEAIRTASTSRGGSEEDRRIARVLMALDPSGPIRFRGKSVLPEGLGPALAEAVVKGASLQPYAEMILAQLPMFWVNVQPAFKSDFIPMVRLFDQARMYLERSVAGYGIERCLYELNPTIACQSTILNRAYATDLESLVHGLEAAAGEPERRAKMPMDRHIAAFLMARGAGAVDEQQLQTACDGQEAGPRVLALVQVMEALQRRTRIAPLPNLTRWLADLAEPALESYHSRTMRERLGEEMQKQAELGVVRGLLTLLMSAKLRQRDESGFQRARRTFLSLDRQIERRRHELDRDDRALRLTAYQTATVAASLVSALGMVLTFVTYL